VNFNNSIFCHLERDNKTEVNVSYTNDTNELITNIRMLIRRIYTLCEEILPPIPEGENPRIAIHTTFNSNAPENYNLPGWDYIKSSIPTVLDNDNLPLGLVPTPHHSMNLKHYVIDGESAYFEEFYGKNK
jgi:hypothetical protein